MSAPERDFKVRYGSWGAVLGAGQGIGRAFADAMARRGLSLLLVDVRGDLLEEAAGSLRRDHGVETRQAVVDLAAQDVGAALERAAQGLDLGLVVYTAMISLVGPFLDERLDVHLRTIRVGCDGALAAAHVLGGAMCRRGRGGLVLTSSLAGFQGTGWVASYSACKAFDLALAEALWWEFRPRGVDVLALVPGSTETPGLMAHDPKVPTEALQAPAEVAEEALDALGRQHLLIPGAANRQVREALEKLPRQQLIEIMGEQTKRQFTG